MRVRMDTDAEISAVDGYQGKAVLPEWALGGPGLGLQEGMLIAWTGTDSAHHLNVARLQEFQRRMSTSQDRRRWLGNTLQPSPS
jgi:hypothetical protein